MQKKNIETRVATKEELSLLLSWAKQEGWNPGLHDADLFYATDNTGFFLTLVDNEPVAGISVVKLNSDHAFLGLYLCKPKYRGEGYGIKTWNTAIKSVGARSIGLDGVVEQQSNYSKENFTYSHRNIRFSGTLLNTNAKTVSDLTVINESQSDGLAALSLFDATIGGVTRHTFFKALTSPSNSRQIYLAKKDDQITGAISVRQCIEGFKIGPWLANDLPTAIQLLNMVHMKVGDEPIMVDVPELNHAAIGLMEDLGLKPIFETARMYRGQKPEVDIHKLFGVATLELG